MRTVIGAVVTLAWALCTPAFAGTVLYQYIQYNLGATGLANVNTSIDPGPLSNGSGTEAWSGLWGGQVFSRAPAPVNIASKLQGTVPADVPVDALKSVPFSIQESGKNAWSGYEDWAARTEYYKNPPNPNYGGQEGLQIDARGEQTNAVFLMMNTFWGAAGEAKVEVILTFDDAPPITYSLVGNTDIRDHNNATMILGWAAWTTNINPTVRSSGNGGYQATVGETVGQTTPVALDGNRQHEVYRDVISLFLPSSYIYNHLRSIRVVDLGPTHDPACIFPNCTPSDSRAFLWGVTTLSSVPEPATWPLIGGGLIGGALLKRRKYA